MKKRKKLDGKDFKHHKTVCVQCGKGEGPCYFWNATAK